MWNQTYGGIGDDQATSLIIAGDGGFVMSGCTNTFGVGSWDGWLIKDSSAGQNPENFSFTPASLVLISIGTIAVAVCSVAVYFKKRLR